ncbi:cytochrome P450 [Fodinicola feengrottensis]|uniref:cytochrome P450 n=1 Tax=Fodinicola feengrottensis TaxID=435914 RepID=UPI0013D646F9|nr:cytochrome P450 [Fodinicola feengrottensis]
MPRQLPVDELVSDPYPIYAALRAEGPAAAVEVRPGYQVWMVTRYVEARQALANPALGNDPGNGRWMADVVGDAVNAAMNKHLLRADPPDHTRLRRLVSKAFSGTRVAALAPWISKLADELLDRIEPGEKVDLLDSFALPLPLQVICELLGIPAGDRHLFRDWSDVIISGAHQRDRYKDMAEALVAYVQRLTAVKRADPQDDLLSDLISVRDDDDQLSDQELTAMVVLLLFLPATKRP